MIYQLGGSHIDLSKLEYISETKRFEASNSLYFQYQLNGTLFTSTSDEFEHRSDLINAWKDYKESK